MYAIGAVFFVLFSETQLWPKLNLYQIMFKVTDENAIPDVTLLSNDKLATLCFNHFDKRPCIMDVTKELTKC